MEQQNKLLRKSMQKDVSFLKEKIDVDELFIL